MEKLTMTVTEDGLRPYQIEWKKSTKSRKVMVNSYVFYHSEAEAREFETKKLQRQAPDMVIVRIVPGVVVEDVFYSI